MKLCSPWRNKGLSMVEVLVVIGVLAILAALILPCLAPRHSGIGYQIRCISNLKQIGLAWLTWAHDNESGNFPFRSTLPDKGSRGSTDPLRNNAWWQYSLISNELSSPKVLVCP